MAASGDDGWPTKADIYEVVTGLRGDVRELCTEMRHGRRELDDHEKRIRSLSRRWLLAAGGVATLAAAEGTGWLVRIVGG